MNLHRWLDVVAQRNMWRYPRRPSLAEACRPSDKATPGLRSQGRFGEVGEGSAVRSLGEGRPLVESTVEEMSRLAGLGDDTPNCDELHPRVDAPELVPACSLARDGFIEEHLRFPSAYRPPSLKLRRAWPDVALAKAGRKGEPALDTVHVLRWRPISRRHRRSGTALVMVHGAYAPDHRRIHWFVPPVGEVPWDTFSMELPHHMRRQRADSTYSGQHFITADVPRLIRAMHQGETDVRALVRGLRGMGYERIVLGGISIGGNIVFESILREPVDGAFALVPSMDAYVSLWESVLGACIRKAGHAAGFTDDLARRALRLVTPLHMGRPTIGGERLLLIYGENDLLCPAGPIRALRDAWGIRNERVLETGHATLVLRFWTVRRTIAAWMRAVTSGQRR